MILSERGYLLNPETLKDWFAATRRASIYGGIGGLLLGVATVRIIVAALFGALLWPWLIVGVLAVVSFGKQWSWRRYAKVRMWQMTQIPINIRLS
jgi:hypothetical protein